LQFAVRDPGFMPFAQLPPVGKGGRQRFKINHLKISTSKKTP
jgi:hypothetical protein